MNEKELLKLKEEIDEAEDELKDLRAKQKYLLEELKNNWDLNSIEEAKELLDELTNDIKTMNKKIEKGIKDVQEKYEFE